MAWSRGHHAFLVDGFIEHGGPPIPTNLPVAYASGCVDGTLYPIKKNYPLGCQTYTNKFCVETGISWSTSVRNMTGECGHRERFDGNNRLPYGSLTALFREFCTEIWKWSPTKLCLFKNWVKEIFEPNSCVKTSFGTFTPQMFSDETHLHLSDAVNKQTFPILVWQYAREHHEWQLHHSDRVVCHIFCKFRVLIFYFFMTISLLRWTAYIMLYNGSLYALLQNFVQPKLGELFDENGAENIIVVLTRWRNSPYISFTWNFKSVQECPVSWTFLLGDIRWPPRSPISSGATSKPGYTNIV